MARLQLFAWSLGSVACGGSDGTATPPPPPVPGITLSLSSASLSVQAGQEGAVQVTVTRTNFTASVILTISDVPAGVSGSFNTSVLPNGASSSQLTIAVARSAVPGTYTTTVTASADGVNAQASRLTLTVTPAPSILVVAKPNEVAVTQGSTGSVTLDVSRTNFNGPVSFFSSGEPPGVVTSFAGTPTTGSLATVSFSVASVAEPGAFSIAVTAVGDGIAPVTVAVRLEIVPLAVPGIDITVAPDSLSVTQNTQQAVTINIVRTAYAGAVVLAASGLPDGAVVVFTPPSTTGVTVNAAVFAGSNTPVGQSTFTVTATGDGVRSASRNVHLTVTAVPAIALSVVPDTVAAAPGSTATSTITISRTNFPGAVTLSANGLPTGATASINATPTTAATATLTLTVASSAAAGTYVVILTGSANGVPAASTTFVLRIM